MDTHVTIIKFTEYNSRKDVKHPTWFRLEHSFFEKPEFFDLTHTEKLAWIYLLCTASKKNSDTFTLSWAHIEKIGGIKKRDFETALEKLQQIQVIHVDVTDTLRARNGHVTDTCATDRQTDITDKTDNIREFDAEDLKKIWNETCKSLPKVQKLTSNRKLHAKQRIAEHPDPSYWIDVAKRIEDSDFCKGTAPSSRGWIATFDWFVKPDTHVKVLEGKYGSRLSNANLFAPGEWPGEAS